MLFDKAVFSSIVMTACVCVLGCLSVNPPKTVLEPIDPVEAAAVSQAVQPEQNDDEQERDKSPVVEKKTEPTIIMHSASLNCPPCERWIANDMENWKKAGWTIPEPLKEAVSGQSYPWFDITDADGLRFQVVGPLTKDTYERERKKALGK